MHDRDWQVERRLVQQRARRARQILDVSDVHDAEQIKRAWRRLSLKHHPDNNAGSLQSHRQFMLVNCAYRFLTEGTGCEELDSGRPLDEGLTDGTYRLDNPWGYFAWWREKYFGQDIQETGNASF